MASRDKIIELTTLLTSTCRFGGPRDGTAAQVSVRLWERAFEDVDDHDLEWAVYEHLNHPKDCEAFPAPGKLKIHLFDRANSEALRLWGRLVRESTNLRPMRQEVGEPGWTRVCKALRAAGVDQVDLPKEDFANRRRDAFCREWAKRGEGESPASKRQQWLSADVLAYIDRHLRCNPSDAVHALQALRRGLASGNHVGAASKVSR